MHYPKNSTGSNTVTTGKAYCALLPTVWLVGVAYLANLFGS